MSAGVVLFVCTANRIRSPLAGALLAQELRARGAAPDIQVRTAGTWARADEPADPLLLAAAEARGMSLQDHRSLPVTAAMLDSDLVLCMEERQRDALARMRPAALPRTFTLPEFLRLAPGRVAPGGGLAAAARSAHRARAQTARATHREDVPDPVGGPRSAFESTVDLLQRHVRELADVLAGPPRASRSA